MKEFTHFFTVYVHGIAATLIAVQRDAGFERLQHLDAHRIRVSERPVGSGPQVLTCRAAGYGPQFPCWLCRQASATYQGYYLMSEEGMPILRHGTKEEVTRNARPTPRGTAARSSSVPGACDNPERAYND